MDWELLNQLAKQVSYQLQHKVPPPPRPPTTDFALYDATVEQASPTQCTSRGRWRSCSGAKKAQRSFLRGARSWPKASRLCSPKPKPTQSQNSTKFDWKTKILVYQGCTLQYWPDPLCWTKSTEIAQFSKISRDIWKPLFLFTTQYIQLTGQ